MAMIKCTECGKEMSDKASVCPNCGCPMEEIRAKLGQIENERKEKARAKEEEKKAKEVEAEARRQRQEEARKAITPEMRRKKLITGMIAGVVVLGIAIGAWYFGIKVPRDEAYSAYFAELQSFNDSTASLNEVIDQYNEKAKKVIEANEALDESIREAQALVDCGDTPYEGDKITTLSNCIKDARNNKMSTPELLERADSLQADPDLESAGKAKIEEARTFLANEQAKNDLLRTEVVLSIDKITVPDYSDHMDSLSSRSKELEDSYEIVKQITAPEEEWIITRLGTVDGIANIAPVTEENDPNGGLGKAGGYTSTVYFGTALLGTEDLAGNQLIDEGTDAGGAVETYRTVEEAESRNDYLASFDGMGWLTSGSHMVLGTMVVRTSDSLKASQQETLTNAIVSAMISLE